MGQNLLDDVNVLMGPGDPKRSMMVCQTEAQTVQTCTNSAWPIYPEETIPGPSKGCPGWTTPHYLGWLPDRAPLRGSWYSLVEAERVSCMS